MDIEKFITPHTLTWKMGFFFLLMVCDIGFTCGVCFTDTYTDIVDDKESINGGFNQEGALAFVVVASSLQVGIQLTLIFWYFFIVWKTFPFRFGLVRELV